MQTENNNFSYNALIYLIACYLNGKKAEKELLSHLEIGSVYFSAVSHSLIAIAAAALENAGVVSARASDMKNNSIRKNMLFDAERGAILAEFEKKGIKYMPLKGVILKDLYPEVGMRQMADNDILFDERFRETVRDIFVERGYEVEHYEKGNHDVYMKAPLFNFEMHVSLFAKKKMDVLYEYYKDALSIAKCDPENELSYNFSDEDYYVYLKAHEYKHYANNGTGIRSLVDIFVFLKAKGDSLDFDYVKAECEKLGFGEYEELTRELAFKIFDPDFAKQMVIADREGAPSPLTEDELDLLLCFTDSATYGTRETLIRNRIERERKKRKTSVRFAKFVCVLKVVFPNRDHFRIRYPRASKCVLLIPFLWVLRGFTVMIKRPKNTIRMITEVTSSKKRK